MEPKLILIVCDKNQRPVFERSLKEALDKERVPYEMVHSATAADAERTMHEAGFPHFVVCEKDAGDTDAGLNLLRKVRQTGQTFPFVVWNSSFSADDIAFVAALNGIPVTWDRPGGLARLTRYATTLLRGQPRDQAS